MTLAKPLQYFLNNADSSVDLESDQSYWLHGESGFAPGNAVRVRLVRGAGVTESATFLYACPDLTKAYPFYRLSGSRKISLGRPGVRSIDRVSATRFTISGKEDHIYELAVRSKPAAPVPQADVVTGISITNGYYLDYRGPSFLPLGRSWDTEKGRRGNVGWALGVAPPGATSAFLNCADHSVVLFPNTNYWVWCDAGLAASRVLKVDVRWASGKTQSAEFARGCSEMNAIPGFFRLKGDPAIKLGRTGETSLDRLGADKFESNKVVDRVFTLAIEPNHAPAKDVAVDVRIEAGSFQFGSFLTVGRYWDTWPGRSGSRGYVLGVTAAGTSKPFENCANSLGSLGSGAYWAYGDSSIAPGSALRVQVQWASGLRENAVFEVGDFKKVGAWKRVAGSANIGLGATGVTTADRVDWDSFKAAGRVDHVWQLSLNSNRLLDFGSGCAGSRGQPVLSSMRPPQIGGDFAVRLDRLRRGATGGLVFGASSQLDLRPFGAPGCTLYVRPDVMPAFATGGGDGVVWTWPIPLDSRFIGAIVRTQAIVFDPAANRLGLALSNAIEGRIGAR